MEGGGDLQDDWMGFGEYELPGEKLVMKLDGVLFLQHYRGVDYTTRGQFVMSNYRVYFLPTGKAKFVAGWDAMHASVPVSTIERMKVEDINKNKKSSDKPPLSILELLCKDCRTLRFMFEQVDMCRRAHMCLEQFVYTEKPEYLFAFYYQLKTLRPKIAAGDMIDGWKLYDIASEFQRMGVPSERWRLSQVNHDYKMCPTYPPLIAVPTMALVTDNDLKSMASFRSRGRIPVLCWKHSSNNVTLFRCSQPKVGMRDNRNGEDEKYIKAIGELNGRPDVVVNVGIDATAIPGDTTSNSADIGTVGAADDIHLRKERAKQRYHAKRNNSGGGTTVMIYDARPKLNAVGNRMAGKGYENTTYYTNARVLFMDIQNIHVMRDSYKALLKACNRGVDHDTQFYKSIAASDWLFHIGEVLKATTKMIHDMDINHVSIVCHCSDGWDRTSQLCALTQLCLDPHYRSLKGFMILIEKEWLSFGHKFNQRTGHGGKNYDDTQRSPIFLQFCDCVYQLTLQFPTHFEFNSYFLVTLVHHLYSCRFGTFLFNCMQERSQAKLRDKTVSLWTYMLQSPAAEAGMFTNPFYLAAEEQPISNLSASYRRTPDFAHQYGSSEGRRTVLYPSYSPKKLLLWSDYFLRAWQGESVHGGIGDGSVPPHGAQGVILPQYNAERVVECEERMRDAQRDYHTITQELDQTMLECEQLRRELETMNHP